ncbi:putative small auxin-up RNA [Rosa chinensis]|uniref:Putative small auxin-up RNA n=1 Tax=Rosa chinensis TaxID=74649 RepID=A0A2P6RV75_ROSCH|nr:auxin-responsive protein SAUR68 [Rosa chinensis]PRQ50328.1 putative small auxin-up RNA [Rosa chinensis]
MDVMLSPKKLIKMTKKLQKVPVIGRKRTSPPTVIGSNKMNSSTADKGTFVIYTLDNRRFILPLSYLCNHIFQELFKMSEEELGISRIGPIVLPCDSLLMNYIVSLVQLGMSLEVEKAILNSIIRLRSSYFLSTFDRELQTNQQLLLCGF